MGNAIECIKILNSVLYIHTFKHSYTTIKIPKKSKLKDIKMIMSLVQVLREQKEQYKIVVQSSNDRDLEIADELRILILDGNKTK